MIIGIIATAILIAAGIWWKGMVFATVVLGLITAAVFFLLWIRKRLRSREVVLLFQQPPAKPASRWSDSKQAFAVGALIIVVVCWIFRTQLGKMFTDNSSLAVQIVVVFALLITILCIHGEPVPFIKKTHRVARYLIAAFVIVCFVWPAIKSISPPLQPKMEKIEKAIFSEPEKPPAAEQKKSSPKIGVGVARKADSRREDTGKTLEHGQRLVITRLKTDQPTPALWTHNGQEWRYFPPWSNGQKSWLLNNDEPPEIRVYLELPKGLQLSDFTFKVL